jgi:hypothetical protein
MFSDTSSYGHDDDREGEDIWSEMDDDFLDDFDDDDEFLTSNTSIDMAEIDRLAERKIVFHKSCLLGIQTVDFHIAALLVESELALNNHEYQSSLVSAKAAEKLAGETLGAATMIEMICVYQMGDRNRAVEIMNTVESNPPPKSQISPFLMKKFSSTCEVLTFMPQLLSMLAAADNKQSRNTSRRRR